MTVPFWCLFAIWFLAYPPSWLAALWILRHERYDNHQPRLQAAQLTGFPLRAKSAHYNSLEALGGFAAAVCVQHLGGAEPSRAAQVSVAFVVVRVAYLACYLLDLSTLRSAVWTLGLTLNGLLFLLPILT